MQVSRPICRNAGKGQPQHLPGYRFSLLRKPQRSVCPLPVFHQDNTLPLVEEDPLCKRIKSYSTNPSGFSYNAPATPLFDFKFLRNRGLPVRLRIL